MSEEMLYKAEVNRQIAIQNTGWPKILIGTGLTLLALNLLNISVMSLAWPLWVLLPGLALAYPAYHLRRHSRLNYLAVPGAFFLAVGGLLTVMNLFNHFEAWAYAWTLLPAAMMAGAMYAKRYQPGSRVHSAGPRFIRGSLITCGVLAAIFELLVFQTLGPWWPVLLVAAGYYLMKNRREPEVDVKIHE
jgi:hypothetical protein